MKLTSIVRPMHSLAQRLTLAFLGFGLLGALLVALLVGLRTRTEFNRFLSERDQAVLVDALVTYYARNGSWQGVADMLRSSPLDFYSRGMALSDSDGRVMLSNRVHKRGQQLPAATRGAGIPVRRNGETIGLLYFDEEPFNPPHNHPPPDVLFLRRVTAATGMSAAVAALLALLLGGLLARTLTRPLRELTAATRAMASGQLDQQVIVRGRDEIAELATSFNQMSADLSRASQLRTQMTADLAHDLRTPLSILAGYTEGLQDERITGTPRLYAIMHSEVKHLARLVDDLRVLSLADAGELSLHMRAVDPSALLERVALAYMMAAEQQGIALRIATSGTLPSILVDTDRITQVLNNLVSNALRYTTAGEIVLEASAEGAQVRLTVRDTGCGIAADDLPSIFDRFYRADKARQRTDGTASGLGLAIARAIVEAHGGTIEVESTLGQGTTFSIRLPVVPSNPSNIIPTLLPNNI